MRIITRLGMTLCVAGVFCYGETFTGKLLDASCYDSSHTATHAANSADRSSKEKLDKECAPTASTSKFAIETSGKKVYTLDHDGNTKATEALQSGAVKPDNDGDVHVSVSGSKSGDTVKVDSIQGKSEHH